MPFQRPEKINPPPTQDQLWGSDTVAPERRLWLAVAQTALDDGDLQWFESFEFELLCETLDVDSEAVRQRLFRKAA